MRIELTNPDLGYMELFNGAMATSGFGGRSKSFHTSYIFYTLYKTLPTMRYSCYSTISCLAAMIERYKICLPTEFPKKQRHFAFLRQHRDQFPFQMWWSLQRPIIYYCLYTYVIIIYMCQLYHLRSIRSIMSHLNYYKNIIQLKVECQLNKKSD